MKTTRLLVGLLFTAFMLCAAPAHASIFQGETLDTVANVLSWVVLVIVPVVGIAVFWLVHILPEKIAEKKQHPQAKAIQMLVPALAVFRRHALAARLAVGLLQAGPLQDGLRHRQGGARPRRRRRIRRRTRTRLRNSSSCASASPNSRAKLAGKSAADGGKA